jgi:hypothetical protein
MPLKIRFTAIGMGTSTLVPWTEGNFLAPRLSGKCTVLNCMSGGARFLPRVGILSSFHGLYCSETEEIFCANSITSRARLCLNVTRLGLRKIQLEGVNALLWGYSAYQKTEYTLDIHWQAAPPSWKHAS